IALRAHKDRGHVVRGCRQIPRLYTAQQRAVYSVCPLPGIRRDQFRSARDDVGQLVTKASVFSALRFIALSIFPLHPRSGSQVPYESLNESHAPYTPDNVHQRYLWYDVVALIRNQCRLRYVQRDYNDKSRKPKTDGGRGDFQEMPW